MALTQNKIVTVQTPKCTPARIIDSDSTNLVTLFTAGADGSKIQAIMATTDETVARTLKLWLTRSSVDYLLGAVSIPIGAGNTGSVAGVDVLRGGPSVLRKGLPIDNTGQPYLQLESGDTLRANVTSTVTLGKIIHIVTIGANF